MIIFSSLGASHSPSDKNHCDNDDNFVMSDSVGIPVSPKKFLWSNCSLNSIYKFIKR